jgi:Zn-dependent protease with chaperone function
MLKYALYSSLLLFVGCVAPVEPASPDARAHWEISPEYVANTLLHADASIADDLKYKQLVQLRRKDLPQVFSGYRKMAKRMNVSPLPTLYLDTEDTHALPQAAARFTREGKAYIVINRPGRELWSARQLTAVLGHELVHLKEEHVNAENLAQAFNHPEISIANELEADRMGSGPQGSCDPQSLEEALKIVFDMDTKRYIDENPLKTSGDYNALIGADHPRWEERKTALEDMAAHPPKGCRHKRSKR